ncbi:MAG TPA: ATP-binding domain-containing protein [Ilumatobacter sp.]|nr:ATP-binding domain-containing protein [Ilumatobacter sp.]
MTLEVVYGESRNRATAKRLAELLRGVLDSGTVYLGYPVLATADERVDIDALLVSREHGLVAFVLAEDIPQSEDDWNRIQGEQDRLYAVLEGYLGRHESLRSRRKLAFIPQTATVFPHAVTPPFESSDGFYGDLDEVKSWVAGLPSIDASIERALQGALQRVSTIKPAKKRTSVVRESSRGSVLKEIERGIANLDRWQKAAAIESPEGPQRIRGLAGSGKTVVLALKAAYLHAQHPEWRVAVTFHTRALYQQIDDLVTRFTFEHSNDRPDPERLQILHSWGSRGRPGIYSTIATAVGEPIRDWSYARGKFGMDDAFRGVCQELLATVRDRRADPIFDAVLIDEAQDLPPEFFQLLYHVTREPKRIVWAYDELQKLSEATMPDTDELFGTEPSGESRVSLESAPDAPRRDIVLPICYRNTPWALATAHALGVGVYRENGLIQHPDQPSLWQDIGYDVVHGTLKHGSNVTLARSSDSSPGYFSQLLSPSDAVVIRRFDDESEQDAWVASQIAQNLTEDELEPDDILIVLPDTYRAKTRGPRLMRELLRVGVDSHLVGVNTSQDQVFVSGSVALAHIYRAKGNEAPMVYVVDAQVASGGINILTKRNTLFTAITRSRAWVRVLGFGERMQIVEDEAAKVIENDFRLKFKVPTKAKLKELRHIYRERPAEDEEAVKKATEALSLLVEAFEKGEVDLTDLPPALRTRLLLNLRERDLSDDD